MMNAKLLEWLLDSDPAIQYQVYRDLFGTERTDLKERVAKEGWGAKLISLRNKDGHWGISFYQPKWTSTHYTLLELRYLEFPNHQREIKSTINLILMHNKDSDGGINPSFSVSKSDVCINGMFLNYACYFGSDEKDLESVIDFILANQLADGGFNCQYNRKGATHSSLHTTLSVCEGFLEYIYRGYSYRKDEVRQAQKQSEEFILIHQLYKSHRTGETINPKFLMLSWPSRWRYDILRALDYFCLSGHPYDIRMQSALDIVLNKQRSDSKWPLQCKHTGKTHFDMEQTGKPSRWNTLRALRVINYFGIKEKNV